MSRAWPPVYLLHGDDEYSLAQFLAELLADLGDPTTVSINTTHLEGNTFSLEELRTLTGSMPFLCPRRIVILHQPGLRMNTKELQKKFLETLAALPPTTTVCLVEPVVLKDAHWLLKWAVPAGAAVHVRSFPLPKSQNMQAWIQTAAQKSGGRFTSQAAHLLAELVGEDTRAASQEIQKLFTYANNSRPIEEEDVELLAAYGGPADIFKLVDAMGNQDSKTAVKMLKKLLDEQEPISILGMVIRQFRLLLLAREVLNSGGNQLNVAAELGVHSYVAGKVSVQARRFSLESLENTYIHLLDVDEMIKTGVMEGDLALETLVARFTTQKL